MRGKESMRWGWEVYDIGKETKHGLQREVGVEEQRVEHDRERSKRKGKTGEVGNEKMS